MWGRSSFAVLWGNVPGEKSAAAGGKYLSVFCFYYTQFIGFGVIFSNLDSTDEVIIGSKVIFSKAFVLFLVMRVQHDDILVIITW